MHKFDVVARALGGIPGAAILAVSTLVATLIAMFGGFVFFVDSVQFFNYAARLNSPGSWKLLLHHRVSAPDSTGRLRANGLDCPGPCRSNGFCGAAALARA